MNCNNSTPSYRREMVSRLTHDDPAAAEILIELMLLTDSQTPIGAAAHLAVIDDAYELTEHRRQGRDRFVEELKERLEATQVVLSQ